MSAIPGVLPAVAPPMMESVVCHAPRDYRLELVPIPPVVPGEILVKVEAVGICASDAKCYVGAPLFWGDEHRVGYCQPPITPGHEFVGRIVKFGDTDGPTSPLFPGLKVGDLATAEQIVPCRCCRYCDRGNYHLCLPHDIYGFRQLTPGAMATYMRWPRNSIIHKIPDHVPPHHAAFVEPLACSIWAVERAEIKFEDVVVVSGCGPLGLGMIAAAKLKNPKLLIALDVVEWKLDIAKACGATVVLNPAVDDVREKVLALTDGYGCDVYIEAAASDVSVTQGLHMLCKGGRFVEYSVFSKPVTVDWTIIGDTKSLDIRGAHLGPNCWPMAIRMIANKQIPLEGIVTHTLPLKEFQAGFDMVVSGAASIKVVLLP